MTIDQILDAYQTKFGELPPLFVWRGEDDELAVLAQRAINSGVALDEKAMIEAQGMKAPDGVTY